MKGKGLIQIYTGDGKGKTTAAIGLTIRAIGQGLKVCYIYFHKNPDKWGYAEYKILKKLGVDVFGFAKEHPFCDRKVKLEDIRKECLKGLEFIKEIFQKNKYDILILDEINISLRDGFLKEEEVLEILKLRPKNLEIVLTGRNAPSKIMEVGDLISEIKEIKHPYKLGIKGRKGIEY
jgi:cob(I)alamin adenosyltransferase